MIRDDKINLRNDLISGAAIFQINVTMYKNVFPGINIQNILILKLWWGRLWLKEWWEEWVLMDGEEEEDQR